MRSRAAALSTGTAAIAEWSFTIMRPTSSDTRPPCLIRKPAMSPRDIFSFFPLLKYNVADDAFIGSEEWPVGT